MNCFFFFNISEFLVVFYTVRNFFCSVCPLEQCLKIWILFHYQFGRFIWHVTQLFCVSLNDTTYLIQHEKNFKKRKVKGHGNENGA
jgi:hypothetical protein